MSKSRKSKFLATMMCAAVMAGLHAAPVMAGDTGLTVSGDKVVADKTVTINGVKFVEYAQGTVQQGITAEYRGHIYINGLKVSNTGAVDMNNQDLLNAKTFTAGNGGNNFKLTSQGVEILVGQQDVNDKFIVKSYAGGNTSGGSAYIKTQNGEVVLAQSDDNSTFNNKLVINSEGTKITGDFYVNGVQFSGQTSDGTIPSQGIGVDNEGNTAVNGVVISTYKAPNTRAASASQDGDIILEVKDGEEVIKSANVSAMDRDIDALNQKTSTITVFENSSKGPITNISSHLNVQGDITTSSDGDVKTAAGASLNGLHDQVQKDALKIHNLQVNTTDIKYEDGVTEIGKGALVVNNEGYVTINNGMLTVDAESGYVTMGSGIEFDTASGNITAKNVYSEKYNLEAVGDQLNELETGVSADITELERKTQDIDYAEGVTTVSGVDFENGTISADMIYANDGEFGNSLQIGKGGTDGKVFIQNGDVVTTAPDGTTSYSLNTIGANTQDIKYADGVTEIGKGALVVNNEGYVTINNGMITADAESGYVTMGEGIEFDTKNGNITANNFYTDKYNLNAIGDQLGELETTVGETNANVVGISRDGETTTIEGTLSVSKDFIGANIEGSIFGVSNEDVTIAHGSNGVAINNMGVHLSGNVYFDGKDGNSYTLADLEDRVSDLEDKTQNITGSKPGTGEGGSTVPPTTDGHTGIEGDVTVGGEINADSGTIGGVTMEDGKLTAGSATIGDVQVSGSLNVADKVTADKDGVTVAGEDGNKVVIDGNDVSVTDKDGNTESIMGNAVAIDNIEQGMASMSNRISQVEDRIDKVGAMSAAIANLRTMGYDPAAPTEIAVGLGQYRSETGAALGLFHYPNRDFMLSLSVSTSGDEVMGGIGATWKFGRKTPDEMLAAEKEKAAAKKLAKARKAEAMKKAAAEAEQAKKVAAQQAKHAKMAAEKAAQ